MKILYRTNNHLDFAGEVSVFSGIQSTLPLVLNPLNAMILLAGAAVGLLLVVRGGIGCIAGGSVVKLLLVALIPFAWMVFACNHTVSHAFFAYRCLSVTIFAGMSALVSLAKK